MLTEANALEQMNAAAASLPPYPQGRFEGRGVVIPSGGVKYFPSAWVCINMLRHVGCTLPIELWRLGPEEMSDEMKSLVEPLGVTCIDALEVRKQHPVRTVGKANGGHEGWELKPYSILHSRFREVLFFDADNMPVVDPTFLFDTPQYREHGAIFWPDPFFYTADDPIWKLTGVPYRHEPQFESGQIVVDKEHCWISLCLTVWMNEHSDLWYRYIYGDKDTFHMAWRKLGYEYAMPEKGYERIQGVMCHHDFEGRRIFQHRHGHKWVIDGRNPTIPGFHFEIFCREFIRDLGKRWCTRPGRPFDYDGAPTDLRRMASELAQFRWRLSSNHSVVCHVTFGLNGFVHEGAADDLQTWGLIKEQQRFVLSLSSTLGCVTHLISDAADWRHLGKSDVHLTRVPDWVDRPYSETRASEEERRLADTICECVWIYRRLRHDQRELKFGRDGYIHEGADGHERWWRFNTGPDGQHELLICGKEGRTAAFRQTRADRWQGRWLIPPMMGVVLVPQE